ASVGGGLLTCHKEVGGVFCLFWAAGLALFTLGVWAQISLADYMLLSANRYPNAPIILLSTGAAVTTWGFLGCLGVAANLPSVLRAYGFFQLAALIAGLAGGLSGLFYREDIAGGFRSGLLRAVAGYTEDEGRADALDSLQRALECCGADGWRDWLASDWASQHMIFLPVENVIPCSIFLNYFFLLILVLEALQCKRVIFSYLFCFLMWRTILTRDIR
uniref:Uncharacterized protein n=1 Tax=Cynoglossus semilaevis TaxID=244447 RepID=A0A3P8V7H4_CYNSE